MLPVFSPAVAAIPPRLTPPGPSRAISAAAASSSRRRVRSPLVGSADDGRPAPVPLAIAVICFPLVDPAIVAAPVPFPQLHLHHLAGGGAGQGLRHVDAGRALEVRQPVPRE